jgi:hypothetical protein
MNFFKNNWLIFSVLLLNIGQVYAMGAKRPHDGTGSTTPEPIPTPLPPIDYGPYVNHIRELAASSACAQYSWKNRGRAPAGYTQGLALTYARGLCRLRSSENTPSALVNILTTPRSSNANKDAVTYFQSSFENLSIQTNVSGAGPLRAVYLLAMGLGMRESSGKYCEGWDRSAGAKRSSNAAEAGLFQTSLDSIGTSPELTKLYNEYKASPTRCFLDIFKAGATCSSMSNLGTGAGADYQAFNKSCPAFATEYAMVMLRLARTHYGPINRKEAEVVPACHVLLQDVQNLVESDGQNVCDDVM